MKNEKEIGKGTGIEISEKLSENERYLSDFLALKRAIDEIDRAKFFIFIAIVFLFLLKKRPIEKS
jgi:hypothetical protein